MVNVGQFTLSYFLYSFLTCRTSFLLPKKCSHPLPHPYGPTFSNEQHRVTYSIGLQGIVMFHQPQEMQSFWPSAALATGTDASDETWDQNRVTQAMPANWGKSWPLTKDLSTTIIPYEGLIEKKHFHLLFFKQETTNSGLYIWPQIQTQLGKDP